MHMADALLSPAVGLAMYAASAGAAAYATKKIREDDLCEKKIPLMGVAGSFVFAAQMINFTIPATGSSGHIGGGILLAALLGACPSLLTIAVVLVIQCLFFADGGLLALGANVFNIGVIPCLLAYPLVFKPILAGGISPRRVAAASIISAVAGLQLGAFAVVLQTLLSGITELPFSTFLLLMQPIHLAIGLAEGVVTASVLCFVHTARPEILDGTLSDPSVSVKKVVTAFALAALFTGGTLSLLASPHPDGLEWSVERAAGTAELEARGPFFKAAARMREASAILPEYNFPSRGGASPLGTTIAGVAGGALTFLTAGVIGWGISRVKRRGRRAAASARFFRGRG